MNSNGPLISAVVPAYNAARFIEQTIHSLVNQTYENIEIVVVDDGSTDETASLICELAQCHPQIRVIQQHNSGVAAARNHGVKVARGDFIAPVDADDIWFPEAAERLIACLLRNDDSVGVAYGWSVTFDENDRLDGFFCCSMIEGDVFNSLCAHNFIGNASSTLIRRNCLEQVGGYDSRFREESAQGCEDWDLYLRIAERWQFRVVPEFLIGYRKPENSMSADVSSMARSHAYFLRKTSLRRPVVPKFLRWFSTSSFYLHLAQECSRRGLRRESYHWLRRALVDGRFLALMRPGFYALATKNALAVVVKPLNRLTRMNLLGARRRTAVSTLSCGREVCVDDLSGGRVKVRMKILAQGILHRVASRLPSD